MLVALINPVGLWFTGVDAASFGGIAAASCVSAVGHCFPVCICAYMWLRFSCVLEVSA